MKYLSFDIEATGLEAHDLIIEFAMVPFDTETNTVEKALSKHFYIKCPSFESLTPKLNEWVIKHNKELIEKAHNDGVEIESFKQELINYFESKEVKEYFNNEKIVLFGKSLNAIDLPFLNRDLGWDFMRTYFHHQVLDLSSVARALVDLNQLPADCVSGGKLVKHLGFGDVAHTALEDAVVMSEVYLKLLEQLKRD